MAKDTPGGARRRSPRRAPRKTKTNPPRVWKPLFLAALAESSNVKKSAEAAGIDPGKAYKLRREDPEFAREWLAALADGYTLLEMEVLCRLREGRLKTDEADKYDFANAIRLLGAHRDSAAQAVAQQRNVSAADTRASIDRKFEMLRTQIRDEKSRSSHE
jgi:hypothetical protein